MNAKNRSNNGMAPVNFPGWIFENGTWSGMSNGQKTVYGILRRHEKNGRTIMTREELYQEANMRRETVERIIPILFQKRLIQKYHKAGKATKLLIPETMKDHTWVFYT